MARRAPKSFLSLHRYVQALWVMAAVLALEFGARRLVG
jgi:hypothetical protein